MWPNPTLRAWARRFLMRSSGGGIDGAYTSSNLAKLTKSRCFSEPYELVPAIAAMYNNELVSDIAQVQMQLGRKMSHLYRRQATGIFDSGMGGYEN